MKYLFVGGKHDGKHLEVEKLEGYNKVVIADNGNNDILCVFVENEMGVRQLMWKLVSGYKAVV